MDHIAALKSKPFFDSEIKQQGKKITKENSVIAI